MASAKRYDTRQIQMFGDVSKLQQSPYPNNTVGELRQMFNKSDDRAERQRIEAELVTREAFYRAYMANR
jgi:hypothetical protein